MHASHGSGEIRSLSRVSWANGLLEIGVIFIAIQWLVIGWMCQIGQSDNYMCGLTIGGPHAQCSEPQHC